MVRSRDNTANNMPAKASSAAEDSQLLEHPNRLTLRARPIFLQSISISIWCSTGSDGVLQVIVKLPVGKAWILTSSTLESFVILTAATSGESAHALPSQEHLVSVVQDPLVPRNPVTPTIASKICTLHTAVKRDQLIIYYIL